MATISEQPIYRINGVIDTAKPVMKNIENIANSCNSWITYDITDGKWSVIVNKAGTSSHSFNDSNIVGSIDVSGTGMDQLYNAVEVQFPNNDLEDSSDYIRLDLVPAERKPNEPDNLLKLNYPLVSNDIQASVIGLIELKQSRVETTIEFTTDYSKQDVLAGDIIDVTNTAYDYTAKKFRVLQTEEVNSGDSIQLKITGMEYLDSIYDGDFTKVTRSNADGVITAGAIGTMATPTVTKFQEASLPRILIESTIPAYSASNTGIINGVEVWYYPIPDTELSTSGSGDEWESVDDEARKYQLHTVLRPNPSSVFAPAEEIKYYITDFTNKNTGFLGNFLIKLRAINDTAKGPMSAHSGLVNYVPKQITDGVDNETEVDDGSGNILTSLGLAALLSLLNGFLRDGDSGVGSLFKKILDVFSTAKGFDLDDDNLKNLANSTNGPMISAQAGMENVTNIAQTSSYATIHTASAFTVPFTGTYKIDVFFDQNASGAHGGRGIAYSEDSDIIRMKMELYNFDTSALLLDGSSGGIGAFGWTDFFVVKEATLTAGTQYQLKFLMVNDTESNPSVLADVDIGWNVYSIKPS